MRDLIQSVFRFSWALSLLGVKGITGLFSSQEQPSSYSTARQVPPETTSLGSSACGYSDDQIDSLTANHPVPSHQNFSPPAAQPFTSASGGSGRLDTSRLIAIGEGLTAGVGDFALTAETQVWSFAAQIARQLGSKFTLPLIQAPGIGDFPGFARLSVRVPAFFQDTVLAQLPLEPPSNLAVPGFRLRDAVSLHPTQPLVHRTDARQTAANLVWGVLSIARGEAAAPTQLQYAMQQSPTLAIVQLGYYEALEAAVNENPNLLPEAEQVIAQYSEIISSLRSSGSEVLAVGIPDPFDTAHFSTMEVAAKIVRVEPSFLSARYGLSENDIITLNGVNEIGFQIFSRSFSALHPDSIISAQTAQEIRSRISQLNDLLAGLADENGAIFYDLAALFRRVSQQGYSAGTRTLSGKYLGGFYSLNGYYPGQTAHAIIANEILQLLNSTYGAGFSLIDLNTVMSSDPALACRPADGPLWSTAELWQWPFQPDLSIDETVFTASSGRDEQPFSVEDNWEQLAPVTPPQPPGLPLQLPPGLEQVLPLNSSASYFGDGISALNVRDPRYARFGSTANYIFGGLAMVDSHLNGSLRIKFTTPVNGISHFEIYFMGGFTGDDAVLVAPQFFRMAFQENRVDEALGLVSSGDLNLQSGEVFNLTVYAQYSSTALFALVGANPAFPKGPITFRNPPPSNCPPPTPEQQQIYASAWAEFEQRPDGNLDFTFYGSMFVPLGPDAVWPLNFVSADGHHATIPASGTVMHPHLQLSTRAPQASGGDFSEQIPFNTIQEFTLFTHNSAFGDAFHLNVPHLGGPAKGRSHLLGRLQIQFGPRTGNSVPIAVASVPPGGILSPLSESPITASFPSLLSPGPQGFNENLRFPMRTYPLDDLSILDDPFDISVGALDLTSGRLLNQLLHRAFISQDLIFALLRVEPCTPQSSFFFRGPAMMVKGAGDQTVFRFQGIVHIPYPAGFKFPHPDFSTGFNVGPDSALDPFLWFHAIRNGSGTGMVAEGGDSGVRSSTGDIFSFRYRVSGAPAEMAPFFEYENHSQEGSFRLHSLAWIDFSNSGTSAGSEDRYDTVTFAGFGIWSKDGVRSLQQAAVQISTSTEKPYIGIQIASGDISNVNTKPVNEQAALP